MNKKTKLALQSLSLMNLNHTRSIGISIHTLSWFDMKKNSKDQNKNRTEQALALQSLNAAVFYHSYPRFLDIVKYFKCESVMIHICFRFTKIYKPTHQICPGLWKHLPTVALPVEMETKLWWEWPEVVQKWNTLRLCPFSQWRIWRNDRTNKKDRSQIRSDFGGCQSFHNTTFVRITFANAKVVVDSNCGTSCGSSLRLVI